MDAARIVRILNQHSIESRVLMGGEVFAFESAVNVFSGEDCSQWVNVTGWSAGQLAAWLGY